MVETPIFTKIAQGLPVSIPANDVIAARNWFRETAQQVSYVNRRKFFAEGAKDMVKSINISSIGSMFAYEYDPKLKDKLPYYDMYPLVFITELYNDGWLGLNLHYLPPYYRAKLMDTLYTITLKEGDKMKVQLSYNILKSASRFKYFQPCVKRYLANHVSGRMMFIEPTKWDITMMLPLARWAKASEDQVYRDSRRLF